MTIKRNFFRDILRDTNSKKYSMTKVAALTTLILMIIGVSAGISIMIINKEIDHILIGELIALLLTLLGFKNSKDKSLLKNKEIVKPKSSKEENVIDNDIMNEEENDEIG